MICWPACKHAFMQGCVSINKKCHPPHHPPYQYNINPILSVESMKGAGGGGGVDTSEVRGAGKRPPGHTANGYTRTQCLRIRQKPIWWEYISEEPRCEWGWGLVVVGESHSLKMTNSPASIKSPLYRGGSNLTIYSIMVR